MRGGGGGEGRFPPPKRTPFFSNIVFEFAKLFLVAVLVRNYKKIDLLTEHTSLQCEFQITVLKNLSRQSQYDFSYGNNDFVIWAACGLEFGIRNQLENLSAYGSNKKYYKRELGHCLKLANKEVLNNLFSPELTAASLAKFTISPVGFEHIPGCEKFQSQNKKK